MNGTVKTIGIILVALVVFKIADKMFLDKALSSIGHYEDND